MYSFNQESKFVIIVLLFIPYILGSFGCSKHEGCVGGISNENYDMFLKNNLWDNFVQKKQYSFVVKNGNKIVDNLTLKTSGEKILTQIKYKGTTGSPDCPTTENYAYNYKIYNY